MRDLWKKIPRFSEFRRAGIQAWYECSDLGLALWLDVQDRLDQMRQVAARALRKALPVINWTCSFSSQSATAISAASVR
jgi:hypothetical protein